MVFTNVYNPRAAINRKNEYLDTFVEEGVTFGANCTIVCGIKVGKYAFIGAGALVNKTVKDFALMVGVPAKQIGWMSVCGKRINMPSEGYQIWECPDTGDQYELKGDVIEYKRY